MPDVGLDERRPPRIPVDLASVLGITAVVNIAAFAPVVRETSLRIPVGLLFILFVPGYALVAAVFPERPAIGDLRRDETTDGGMLPSSVTHLERIVLSFAATVTVVPVVGLALDASGVGVRLVPMMGALTAVTVLAAVVGTVRRRRVPRRYRYRTPIREWLAAARSALLKGETGTDVVIAVVVLGALLFAVGSGAYAVTSPSTSEEFTEFTLLVENEDGELVADDYPTDLEPGERGEIYVSIDNHERETVMYTVVAVEQRTETDGGETRVREQQEVDRFRAEVAPGETWTRAHEFDPAATDGEVRIVWLLYRGVVPDDPTIETADRHVALWVDVSEA